MLNNMIEPVKFYESLIKAGSGEIVIGVPDSLLKNFSDYLSSFLPKEKHIIAANEGTAVGIATGFYLSSSKIPLIYLQNSGLGNAINPLVSLADPEVYGIPMILMVGWRGEPSMKDEPQHIMQGRITPALIDSMEIPYFILDNNDKSALNIPDQAVNIAYKRSGPVIILVKKNVFSKCNSFTQQPYSNKSKLNREYAIGLILSNLPVNSTIFSTTGHISREVYEYRVRSKQDSSSDFLTVGSMGHASQIALGAALSKQNNVMVCLDGDGAALMHMGGLATIGSSGAKNLIHILLNNGAHDSVGGQPTVGFDVSFTKIALSSGYKTVLGPLIEENAVAGSINKLIEFNGPTFVEVRVNRGARPDLGRPKELPKENKIKFMRRLNKDLNENDSNG